MITTLKEELSHEAMLEMDREELREDLWDKRAIWLEDHNAQFNDVLTDDEDNEFIFSGEESGTPGDDYQITTRRLHLPNQLQRESINFPF